MSTGPASPAPSPRVELYRLLADEDRLRLLAICQEAELSVGELAELLAESQPQITKKSQLLRDAQLLVARREGTRTLLSAHLDETDGVVSDALEEGRRLCRQDGSLARVAAIVRRREESSRRFFEELKEEPPTLAPESSLLWLEALGLLLPARSLAVDAGTGEGALLPLLSAIYRRVIAVDRSPARLARCAARVAALNLSNVRLREGDAQEPALYEEVTRAGGADLVVCARILHHLARPKEALAALARLLRLGGALLVIDYEPHQDETLRETQGDVWLGFHAAQLAEWISAAGLTEVHSTPLSARTPAQEPDHQLPLHATIGVKRHAPAPS